MVSDWCMTAALKPQVLLIFINNCTFVSRLRYLSKAPLSTLRDSIACIDLFVSYFGDVCVINIHYDESLITPTTN